MLAALFADAFVLAGVSVLGLGALNKAEFINRGGEDVLEAFTPRKTRQDGELGKGVL